MFKDKKIKFFRLINSIRVQIFALICVVITLPVVICNIFMLNVITTNYVEQKSEKLQNQNTILKNCIISESYMDTLDSAIVKAEANRISSGYDGRIEIINADFVVVSDTYVTDEGKTNISEMVIRSMAGENLSYYNDEEEYLEFANPIIVTDIYASQTDESNGSKVIGTVYVRYSTSDVTQFANSFGNYVIAIDIIAFALAMLVAFFASIHFSKPFIEAADVLEKVSAGDIETDISIKGYTEITQIGDAIKHLLDRIKKQEDSRQEFVSNVSHELKTPITSMKVLADSLIGQQNVPEELYQEFLIDIGKEIDRENDIITDLLALVKMDKDRTELNIGSYNINEIVELTLKRLRPIAATKNIEVVFESFRPVIADVDDVKITIVFSNLVENAIKYNVNDGWVRVSLNADHQYLYFTVADSGIGIAEEDKDKVFERFFRVDKARSRETGGTGLGLAITRRIILMHKGSVKVHSKEGEGTTFTVRIPLKYIA